MTLAAWSMVLLVAAVGLAHAAASWVYFARMPSRLWWMWPLSWLLATAGCIAAARHDPWLGYGLFAGLVAVWTIWWAAIRASSRLEWTPDTRYQATGTICEDVLTVRNARNFDWRSKQDFDQRWETRVYDIAKLSALDVYLCTWGDPRIAHVMLSFDFVDGEPLCISVETRREVGERWTALAGFMKSYELIMIAGDERDLVRSRVNIRGETVRLYRVYSTPQMRRKILVRTIAQMNRLAAQPRFYNTVFHNCTVEIARIVRAAGQRFPFDWRILVSGYVDEYLYDSGLLDRSRPFAELKAGPTSGCARCQPIPHRTTPGAFG